MRVAVRKILHPTVLYSKNRSPTKEFRGTYIEMEIVGYEQ